MGVDPSAQSDCLLVGEAAAAALVAKALQPLGATSLIGPMPIANRVVVQQQGLRDALAAPALVEKDDGVGSAGHAMLRKSIPSKPGQGSPLVSREKSAANHIPRRIPFARNVKEFLGFSKSRSIAGNLPRGVLPSAPSLPSALDRRPTVPSARPMAGRAAPARLLKLGRWLDDARRSGISSMQRFHIRRTIRSCGRSEPSATVTMSRRRFWLAIARKR